MRSHHVGNRLSFRDLALRFYAGLTPDSSPEAWHIFYFYFLVNRNSSDLMGNPSEKTGNPSEEFGLPQALKRGELKRKGARLRKIGMFLQGMEEKAF